MTVVVDTNVAVVANSKAEQASLACISNCTRRLGEIIANGERLALDNQWLMIGEYTKNLRSDGQPGPGDRFLRWVLTNRANVERCIQVSITPLDADPHNFVEFPADPRLDKFDPSDRVFVAVARAHPDQPPVLEAVDTDWWLFRDVLADNSIRVEFVCVDDIQRLASASS